MITLLLEFSFVYPIVEKDCFSDYVLESAGLLLEADDVVLDMVLQSSIELRSERVVPPIGFPSVLLEFGSISCGRAFLAHALNGPFGRFSAVNVPKEAPQASLKFREASQYVIDLLFGVVRRFGSQVILVVGNKRFDPVKSSSFEKSGSS